MRIKPNSKNQFFHPFEICFSGFSNSGKTTLISTLIRNLKNKYDIGYFKHDAHKFTMDHKEKDTWKVQNAGAKQVYINDANHSAVINYLPDEQIDIAHKFLDSDLLFIEGHKHEELPKILIISDASQEETLHEINAGKISNIMAVITESFSDPLKGQYPHFQRDQIGEISFFIEKYLKAKVPQKIYGLVLTGGKSQRMKIDKGGLIYHKQNQISHTQNLLKQFCDEVFVSCTENQKDLDFLKDQSLLYDSYPGDGPSIGILSAQLSNPSVAWLVIGCDLPYLTLPTLKDLIDNRNPFKNATCFLNPKRHWPEPICTIYEPKSFYKLIHYYAHEKPCPRKVLFNSNINALNLKNELALNNVNTPEQRDYALNYIKENGDLYAD